MHTLYQNIIHIYSRYAWYLYKQISRDKFLFCCLLFLKKQIFKMTLDWLYALQILGIMCSGYFEKCRCTCRIIFATKAFYYEVGNPSTSGSVCRKSRYCTSALQTARCLREQVREAR